MMDVARILARMVAYRRQERLDPAPFQERRLRALLSWVKARSPFYRDAMAGLDPATVSLGDLPVMDKTTLMARWDDMVCDPSLRLADVRAHLADPQNDGRPFRGHVVVRTSGTGGIPAVILYDSRAFAEVKALQLARAIPVVITPPRLVTAMAGDRLRTAVILAGTGFQPAKANFHHLPRAADLFFDVRMLPFDQPLADRVDALNRFRPHLLMAYPSVLDPLADAQLAGRLDILAREKETHVISVSEALEPWLRQKLKTAFQAPVRDIYGAGECLALARSCPAESGLHVHADAVICEVVDRQNRPVPPGVVGERILVTCLFNRIFPVVRYALPDMAAWDPSPCPCGSRLPRLTAVRGRSDLVLQVPGRDGADVSLHPYLFLEPFRNVPGLADFQVVQGAGGLLVRVTALAGASLDPERVAATVRRVVAGVGGEAPVRVEVVERLQVDAVSSKVKRFFREETGV